MYAHRSLESSTRCCSKILETEPERLLAAAHRRVGEDAAVHRRLPASVSGARGRRRGGCATGSTSTAPAEYLARVHLSLINAPGRWDFDDPAQVRELVRDELLGGIVA